MEGEKESHKEFTKKILGMIHLALLLELLPYPHTISP
jgi:hypothetical protein